MRWSLVGLLAAGLMGCGSSRYPVVIGDPRPDVVVVGDDGVYRDDDDYGYEGERRGKGKGRGHAKKAKGYRTIHVPPGHYPPRGACRVWYAGRPPGHQPRPVSCNRLYGRAPYGAFILYNGNAWDADYDWYTHERRYRGSVPRVIIDIMRSRRR